MRIGKQRAWKVLPVVAVVTVLAGWFFLLRPVALGGPASYVIVAGHSMEPTLHMHDLAIMRKQDSYGVGDVVAFRVDGGRVIHRIIGVDEGEGFIVQGDNNDAPDLWRPRGSDIEGAMWLHLPAGGRSIEFFFNPVNVAIVAGSIALFFLLVGSGTKPRTEQLGEGVRVKSGDPKDGMA